VSERQLAILVGDLLDGDIFIGDGDQGVAAGETHPLAKVPSRRSHGHSTSAWSAEECNPARRVVRPQGPDPRATKSAPDSDPGGPEGAPSKDGQEAGRRGVRDARSVA